MSRVYFAILGLAMVACTRPYDITVAPGVPGATVETVYVSTQQTPSVVGAFSYNDRITQPQFSRIDVTIPPTHVPGRIEAARDIGGGFTMASYQPKSQAEYIEALAAAPGDEILLFIHGYNSTTTEAVFRLAQIGYDFDIAGVKSVFSWASAASPGAYVYDRDSVLFARDDLTQLLTAVSRGSDKRITLLAHSMGAQLTMEAMRQLAIAGDDDVLADVETVILLSPDIDPDIFRRQVEVIGDRNNPYVILTSGTDRALRLSSFLIGGRSKVGQLDAADDVEGLNVIMIDLTGVSDGGHGDHMVAVTSPSAINLLRQISSKDMLAQSGVLLE
ncbi:alpha/beta hydrolase [Yoonia maritima]|uniref:alpha/beta hydrolase n=1 Tax=Yoonia maritima TaxID=1435347 RepID=UPI0013A626FB|nr:alpha/beta fold hydrolase [Yoonia maritima]